MGDDVENALGTNKFGSMSCSCVVVCALEASTSLYTVGFGACFVYERPSIHSTGSIEGI